MSLATLRPDGVIDLHNVGVTGAATADVALSDDTDSSYATLQDNSTSIATIRPTSWNFTDLIGTLGGGANWQQFFTSDGLNHPVDGGGFSPLEVSDNDDGSYLFNSAGSTTRIGFGVGPVTIPALAQITQVRTRARIASTSSQAITLWLAIGGSAGPFDSSLHNTSGSVIEIDGAWQTLAPDGSGWTADKVNACRLVVELANTAMHVAELFVDVQYENEPSLLEVSFNSVTIPANSQIRSVTPRVRHDQSIAPQTSRNFAISVAESFFPNEMLATESGLTTQSGQTRPAQPSGAVWDQASIDALTMRLAFYLPGGGLAAFDVAEAYLDILYNQPMVPTGTGPNAIVTTTTPTWTWTATDADGDAQERFRIKVFADYQYSESGFDPNTATPIVDSGEIFSGDQHWTAPVSLFGHTYHAFIYLADVGSNGRYNTVTADGPYAWASTPVIPLAAPSLVITEPPNPGDPFELEIVGSDNVLSTQGSDFEEPASGSDVGEWTNLSNATATCESGVTGAPSGSHAMNIEVTATADAFVSTPTGLNAFPIPAGAEQWGVVYMEAVATGRQMRAELHWFDVTGTLIDTTLGNVTTLYNGGFTPAFVHGASIYSMDAVYVALGVTIIGPGASEHFRLDNARLSPNPINQMLTPGFDIDSDGNGLADNWSLVNTGGDPDPVPTIDRSKVWGGSASQRLDWSVNGDTKGVGQTLEIPSGAIKFVQAWVAIKCASGPTPLEILCDFLPNGMGPVPVPNDGTFVPITVQMTNTGSFGTGTLKVVSQEDGDVTMWIGEVVVLDQDPGVGGDWGGQFDGTGFAGGGPKDIMSGTFTHGGASSIHHYELQRSIDGGITWVTLTRAATNEANWHLSDLSDIAPALETQIVDAFDFEAPTLSPVMYRARSFATLPTGEVITSDWGRWWTVTAQSAGWQVISIMAPAQNLVYENPLDGDIEWTITYDTKDATEHPLGRNFEVVMSDAVTGAHIPFDAQLTDEDEYTIYDQIRKTLSPVIHRTPMGKQFYARFVGTHTVMEIVDGDTFQTLRTITATLVEIDMP